MGAAVPIRDDIPAEELRRLARQEGDGRVAWRLLGLANVVDGRSRERAARQAGMDRQTLRDWVIRLYAEGSEGLRDRPRSGRPPWLENGQLAALKALVLRGPDPERDGVSSWRAKDLCRAPGSQDRRWWSVRSGASSIAAASAMPRTACCGCSTTSACRGQKARPIHPEADRQAQARFKNNSRR